jgi:hypothetical protein
MIFRGPAKHFRPDLIGVRLWQELDLDLDNLAALQTSFVEADDVFTLQEMFDLLRAVLQ